MNKILLTSLLLSFTFLSACGGSESSNSTTSTPETEINLVKVSSTGTTSDINETGKYNLKISGTGNLLTVKEDNEINALKISGTGNTLIIEDNTTVNSFTISGTGNTVFIPIDSGISFSGSGTGNLLKTTTKNSIIGIWSYTYPSTQCIESYEFEESGKITVTSLDEVATGYYSFDEKVISGNRHALSFNLTTDNGLPDCSGVSEDNTGLSLNLYISFDRSAAITMYDQPAGGVPIIMLTKQ
ncbi:hypothetical protein FE845_18440 [Marinobacter sp. 1-4A]|uniref:hypothetical protein n=1 Tax=unclassified Marinobacter TaxID=83889 RepID=UPI0019083A8F|nr:hypothetical protein [Marinobacter sp. 1-4A]MBK1853325.1 hypothetical protein [Marinobacter sp. 1-4A]